MNRQAFTLLELIIVLALLAILASVAVARFVDLSKKALDIQEYATIDAVRTAVLLYKAKYDAWPDVNPFTLLDNPPPSTNAYPPNIPDPNNRNWYYRRVSDGASACSALTGQFWQIWCPHASGASPWVGREWAYMVVTGPDYWSTTGNCEHQAGSIVYIDWRIGH